MLRFLSDREGKVNRLKLSILPQDFNEIGLQSNMFKRLLRDRFLLLFLVLALLIKLFSLNPSWVERFYTYGFYPFISRLLRLLLGWIPFSIGDILYLAAGLFLVAKTWKLIRLI